MVLLHDDAGKDRDDNRDHVSDGKIDKNGNNKAYPFIP